MSDFFSLLRVREATTVQDLSLALALATWLIIIYWLWRYGWRVQRRYFIEATLTPYKRTSIVWTSALFGAATIVTLQLKPSAPAIVSVAMIGALSVLVDARTHKLPNAYTDTMAIGGTFGALCMVFHSETPLKVILRIALSMAIWAVPLWILSRIPGGVGFGDVKIAPVLGALLGCVGIQAAYGGLIISFVLAGGAALWRLVVGNAGTGARIPLGPWLILGAAGGYIGWGAILQWQ